MGDVEDASVVSDGEVFIGDARILDRHHPPGEGDESGAVGQMNGFQRRMMQGGWFHDGS
jgi:hypothetical protein